ncbi:MAG TPA: EAL domain-containing protein [Solirubrobacteraceae bacterium]|nr:EAL domain-containing protein [Solirubrobacteraceae bacterium]
MPAREGVTVEALDLVAQLGDAVVASDIDGYITAFNPAAEVLYGYSAEEAIGRHVSSLAPDASLERLTEDHERARAGETVRRDGLALTSDGITLEVTCCLAPLRTGDGASVGVVTVLRDNSERLLRERQLLFMSRLLGETDSLAVVGTNKFGTVTVFNRGAELLLGYTAEEVVGKVNAGLFQDTDELSRRATEMGVLPSRMVFRRAVEGELDHGAWTYVRKDGSKVEVLQTVRAVMDLNGDAEGFIAVARDISETRRAELARMRAEERFRIAFEHAPIGLAIGALKGPDAGRWTQTNPALARMLGREPGELDGVLISDVTHPNDRERTVGLLENLREQPIIAEKRYLHKDDTIVWAYVSSTPVPSADGGPADYCVTQVLDISERRHFEQQLHYLADHDPLTGLHNRRRFEAELARVVAEALACGERGALLVLDLDGFKIVNDRFGHSVGDDLVAHIGRLLRQSVRNSDFIARLGGDEFAIILRDCALPEATGVAEKVLDAIRTRGLVVTPKATARVTTSIGIALYGPGINATADELAVEADMAMYEAKADGRNAYAVYSPHGEHRSDGGERDSWFARLRRALDEDRFVLYAQPIVPICGAGLPRYELLVRMLDNGQILTPGAFLLNAERFDLIGELDRWVLSKAVGLLHEHSRIGNDFSLSVNLSGKTMNDLQLAGDLGEILRRRPIPSGRLVVEVTETAAIVNIERARELAQQLRQLGCLFALDDFGSGFSSFYYLKHLQFDYLKIDGEFITKLVSTRTDQLLVQAVVGIARGLGTQTVAEFVGDSETVALLERLGVDYGQGYHLGRPAPVEKLLPSVPHEL